MRAGFDKSLIAILWLLLYYLTQKGQKGTYYTTLDIRV